MQQQMYTFKAMAVPQNEKGTKNKQANKQAKKNKQTSVWSCLMF